MKKNKFLLTGVLILILISLSSFCFARAPEGTNIDVSLINQQPDPVTPGQVVELSFRIQNLGMRGAENIDIELLPKYPFTAYGRMNQTLGGIQGLQYDKEGIIVKFKVRVDPGAIVGKNYIDFKYRVGNFGWVTIKDFEVSVQETEPVISIKNVKSSPENIAPGEVSKVTLTLENSADSIMRNIRVKLGLISTAIEGAVTSFELPFTPLGSSDEKTISFIDPRKTENVEFTLMADSDAESRVYKVPVLIEYTDVLGNRHSKTSIIGLIIGDSPDLIVSISDTNIMSVGQAGRITIRITNKGLSDVKLLYMELMESENYDIISQNKKYIGNVDSDDWETEEFSIYVKSGDGNIEIPIKLEFRDSKNKVYTKTVTPVLRLYTSSELKRFGMGNGNPLVGIVILILIVVGGYFAYKKIKKKKNAKKK